MRQGRAQASEQLPQIAVGPEMHEEEPRLLVQHVIVQRRHFDTVRSQGAAPD